MLINLINSLKRKIYIKWNFYSNFPILPILRKRRKIYWWQGPNFGDVLAPIIFKYFLDIDPIHVDSSVKKKIIGLGSILSVAKKGDIVWGSGCKKENMILNEVNFISVRGPLTKEHARNCGADIKNCLIGDPAMLMPVMIPKEKLKYIKKSSFQIGIAAHINDNLEWHKVNYSNIVKIDLNNFNWKKVLEQIVNSDVVLTSSLHVAIIADSYNIPVSVIKTGESSFKFYDYFLSVNSSRTLLDHQLPFKKVIDKATTIKKIDYTDLKLAIERLKNST